MATALSALDQAGEEMARATAFPEARRPCADHAVAIPNCALTCLYGIPEVIIDNAKGRDLLKDPPFRRIEPRMAASCLGVLEVGKAVPDKSTDIELVVFTCRA